MNPELNYDNGVSVADLVELVIKRIPMENVFEFIRSLSMRGFTIGNKIPNLNKPFKIISENPVIIDLSKIETDLKSSIHSISKCIEDGLITKAEISVNYSQLKQLENITYSNFTIILERFI